MKTSRLKRVFIKICCILFFPFGHGMLYPEITLKYGTGSSESKWDRVLELGTKITQGDVVSRLCVKDSILFILLEEDPDYPTVYVDQTATGACDGSSWENAFTRIQDAIDALYNFGMEGWVWVAKGNYWAITIRSRIMVFGGFSGNETILAARYPEENETIIEGGWGIRGVDMEHLTLIDGFTVRGGDLSKEAVYGNAKAGMLNEVEGLNNTLMNQVPDVILLGDARAGGGIRTMDWFSIIRNNRVTGNIGKGGGGISVWNYEDHPSQTEEGYAPIVERNLVYNNQGDCGAGVQIRQSEALFSNNVVFNNYFIPEPGQQDKSKGVEIVINPNMSDKPIVVNSILWHNSGLQFGDLYIQWDHWKQFGYDAYAKSYYNCIEKGGYGEGLMTVDPLFTDPYNGDFTLQETSPCIDAGHPEAPKDPDGTRADMGVYFAAHYQLSIDDGGVGSNPVGNGNYFSGTLVTISTDSVVFDSLGTTRYSFLRWEGEGPGSYTGDSLTATVRMDGRITETIVWDVSYWLQVNTGCEADSLSGWYDAGTVILLKVPALLEVGEGERRKFISWSGEGLGSQTSDESSIAVTMEGPVVETAFWETEYYLTVNSDYGSPTGESWYVEGSNAVVSIDSTAGDTLGVRHRFSGWTGTGEGSMESSEREITVVVNGPIVQTAHWELQYFCDAGTSPWYGGTVTLTPPDRWYDVGIEVQLEAMERDTHIIFVDWAGDISDSTNPVAVVMDSPKRIVANFTTSPILAPRFLGIPDTTIHEDEALILFFSSLSRYVMDPNDPIDSLRFFLGEGSRFSLEVDSGAGELRFLPEHNWSGAEVITLKAVDPWGLSDSTAFEVTVLPVADPPELFWLLLPPDGTVLSDTVDLINFVWEEPMDVDSGDTIGYDFYVSPDSSFTDGSTIRITSLTDTTLLFMRDRIEGMVYWGVKATDVQGLSTWSSERWRLSVSTDVEGEEEALPGVFVLYQNFPNPFNSETQITYQIPELGRVRLEVFDVRGRHVRTLVDREQGMGGHTVGWEGRDDFGREMPSGVYVLQLSIKRECFRKKMTFIR